MQGESYLAKRWVPPLWIALCILLVWGQTVRFNFVWDDYLFIVKNPGIRSLKNIPEMFWSKRTHSGPCADPVPVFRPVRTVHYALLHALGRSELPQPWVFHLANVLWHTTAAMLFYSVALLLFQQFEGGDGSRARTLALLVSLSFAVHPVTSEIVCWAKSLEDIMAAVFTLAALRSLLKWTGGPRFYCAALVWFTLAVYSKESAVPFALVTLFVLRAYHKQSWRRSLVLASGFFAVAFVFVLHRHLVLGRSTQCAPLSGTYGQTLVDMLPVIPMYLRLLFGVPPFRIDYSYLPGHYAFFSGEVLLGLTLLLLTIGTIVWLWRTRPLAALALLWFSLFLLPVSNLLPMMQYMAERFLYLPLIGFLLLVGFVASRIPRPRLVPVGALGLLLVWSAASLQRVPSWKDELTLFTQSLLEGPRSKRLEKNTLVAIFRLPHVQKVFPIDPETTTLQMADHISVKDAEPVIQTLETARQILPENPVLASCLGLTWARLGHGREALEMLALTARLAPSSPDYWLNLALVQMQFKENTGARASFKKVLSLAPANHNALRYYAQLCQQSGDYSTALRHLKTLHALEPGNAEVERAICESEDKLKAEGHN